MAKPSLKPKSLWAKKIVRWIDDGILYLSVVFTWQLCEAMTLARDWPGRVVAGGPAVDLVGCDEWADRFDKPPKGVDVLSMHNPEATFTTRGCVRRCEFCAVPKTEGRFRELRDWKPRRLVCDSNFLAASQAHVRGAIRRLRSIEGVDFNQGLDARLFTPWYADQIAKLKRPKVRFALDDARMVDTVGRAVTLAKNHGLRDISVYALVGFQDTPESARERLEIIRGWKVWPFPMRYQPLDAKRRNGYLAPGWMDDEMQDMVRYYSKLGYFGGMTWEQYREHENSRRFMARVRGTARRRPLWR